MSQSPGIQMVCPSCGGISFMVEFGDTAVLARGPVTLICSGCTSRWTGTLNLEKGFVRGPCCTDGYEEV